MILRLDIQAFKAFEHATVELEPFSVFVGQNGSGKTSVLQAVEFFRGLVVSTLPEHLGSHGWNYRDLPRLKAGNMKFGFAALLDLDGALYYWRVGLALRRGSYIDEELVLAIGVERRAAVIAGAAPDPQRDDVLMRRNGRKMERLDHTVDEWEDVEQTLTSSWLASVDPREDGKRFPGLVAVAEWARRIEPYVVLDPNRLREPSRLSSSGIGSAGQNLAGFLRDIRTRRPDAFDRVEARVRDAYPKLEEVEIQSEKGSAFALAVRESWSAAGNPLLNARQASDGLLRLFAFAALSEVSPTPTLIMVDELENGVHPQLLGSLVGLLEGLAEDGIQVLATSHSPLVLNYVSSPSSVVLTVRGQDGRAGTAQLDHTTGFDELSSALSAGEMWLAVGEQGLIDGPADRVG